MGSNFEGIRSTYESLGLGRTSMMKPLEHLIMMCMYPVHSNRRQLMMVPGSQSRVHIKAFQPAPGETWQAILEITSVIQTLWLSTELDANDVVDILEMTLGLSDMRLGLSGRVVAHGGGMNM